MAAAIQSEWEAEAAKRAKQGIETVFIGDVQENAYLEAIRKMAVRRQFTVTSAEGVEFEEWVSYVVANGA
jgi:hypothetical protein